MLFNKSNPSSAIVDMTPIIGAILDRAIETGASDIHFEPTRGDMQVKFRLDGYLNTVDTIAKSLSENIVSRLKVMANLLTYRHDIPQEGRLEAGQVARDDLVEVRLSVFPTVHGQRAVLRLFFADDRYEQLGQLGLPALIVDQLEAIVQRAQGVLLVTGPAGSGKSTTLAALLRLIVNGPGGKSVIALEDPVERHIDGVTQIQINTRGELNYPTALRSLLRQDPQVLMVGEIRDAETARIVVEAGLTGHLLLSTMHSGTPARALLRLLEMGIEPYQLTSSIGAVLNQRLVRKLCPHCKQSDDPGGEWKAAGCDQCLNTGYRGRHPLAELVEIDGELRQAILSRADVDQFETLLEQRGHMNLKQNARALMSQGITTKAEIEALLQESQ